MQFLDNRCNRHKTRFDKLQQIDNRCNFLTIDTIYQLGLETKFETLSKIVTKYNIPEHTHQSENTPHQSENRNIIKWKTKKKHEEL